MQTTLTNPVIAKNFFADYQFLLTSLSQRLEVCKAQGFLSHSTIAPENSQIDSNDPFYQFIEYGYELLQKRATQASSSQAFSSESIKLALIEHTLSKENLSFVFSRLELQRIIDGWSSQFNQNLKAIFLCAILGNLDHFNSSPTSSILDTRQDAQKLLSYILDTKIQLLSLILDFGRESFGRYRLSIGLSRELVPSKAINFSPIPISPSYPSPILLDPSSLPPPAPPTRPTTNLPPLWFAYETAATFELPTTLIASLKQAAEAEDERKGVSSQSSEVGGMKKNYINPYQEGRPHIIRPLYSTRYLEAFDLVDPVLYEVIRKKARMAILSRLEGLVSENVEEKWKGIIESTFLVLMPYLDEEQQMVLMGCVGSYGRGVLGVHQYKTSNPLTRQYYNSTKKSVEQYLTVEWDKKLAGNRAKPKPPPAKKKDMTEEIANSFYGRILSDKYNILFGVMVHSVIASGCTAVAVESKEVLAAFEESFFIGESEKNYLKCILYVRPVSNPIQLGKDFEQLWKKRLTKMEFTQEEQKIIRDHIF